MVQTLFCNLAGAQGPAGQAQVANLVGWPAAAVALTCSRRRASNPNKNIALQLDAPGRTQANNNLLSASTKKTFVRPVALALLFATHFHGSADFH